MHIVVEDAWSHNGQCCQVVGLLFAAGDGGRWAQAVMFATAAAVSRKAFASRMEVMVVCGLEHCMVASRSSPSGRSLSKESTVE